MNPLPQGLGGYTQRVRSRAPTEASKYKKCNPYRSGCKPSLDKPSGRVHALSLRLEGYCRVP